MLEELLGVPQVEVIGPSGMVPAAPSALFIPLFKSPDTSQDPLLAEVDDRLGGQVSRLISEGEISGAFKEFTIIHNVGGDGGRSGRYFPKVIVMGVGEECKGEQLRDRIRSVAARAARTLRKIGTPTMTVSLAMIERLGLRYDEAAEAVVTGTVLGLHKFARISDNPPALKEFHTVRIVADSKASIREVRKVAERHYTIARCVNEAKVMSYLPANVLTPEWLERYARKLARSLDNVKIKVFNKTRLEKMGMGGLLGVGRGSEHEPRLIELHYQGSRRKGIDYVLVGKGITFDSGGISIKPSAGMHKMKYDMSGAAAVLAAFKAVAANRETVNVTALIPTCENMPDGGAYKPGDILTIYGGKTVEITNTDAEGRLILADALSYGSGKKPRRIIDVATLTGGVVIALGHIAVGLMGNDESLMEEIREAGALHAEKFWPLPLYPEYREHLKSGVADIKNSGGRAASSSTAGKFLEEFVAADIPWAHLDIAGTAWIAEDPTEYVHKPYLPRRGPTGITIRTLVELLSSTGGSGGHCNRKKK